MVMHECEADATIGLPTAWNGDGAAFTKSKNPRAYCAIKKSGGGVDEADRDQKPRHRPAPVDSLPRLLIQVNFNIIAFLL